MLTYLLFDEKTSRVVKVLLPCFFDPNSAFLRALSEKEQKKIITVHFVRIGGP